MAIDTRVFSTALLLEAVLDCNKSGYNRGIESEWVMQTADPDGFHVAKMLLFDHSGVDKRLPMHHRVGVLMKQKDSMEPFEFMLDISAPIWNWAPTVEEFDAALKAQEGN